MEIIPRYSSPHDASARHYLLRDQGSGDMALLDCPPGAVEADLDFILAQSGSTQIRQIFLSHAHPALHDAAERIALLLPEIEVVAPFWSNWDLSAQEYLGLGAIR